MKIKPFIEAPFDLWQFFVTYWPGNTGYMLRRNFWRKRVAHLGKDVKIDTGVYFQNPQFITIGDNCWIDKDVVILAGLDDNTREKVVRENVHYPGKPGEVYVGNNIHVAIGCIFSGISAGIYIDDNCGFSAGCKVYAFTSHYRSEKDPENSTICFGPQVHYRRQCIVEGPVYLEKNVGVALNAVILPGVTIEKNSFVSVNTVVNNDVRMNSIYRGNPGKVVAQRFRGQ